MAKKQVDIPLEVLLTALDRLEDPRSPVNRHHLFRVRIPRWVLRIDLLEKASATPGHWSLIDAVAAFSRC